MANGPHSADVAQRYILQMMKANGAEEELDEIFKTSEGYNGTEEWSVGEVFDEDTIENFEEEGLDFDWLGTPDYGFKAVEEIYGVIDTTVDSNNGGKNKRLEGLRALGIGFEFPVDGRTQRNWIKNYRDAGLIIQDDEIEVDSEDGSLENIRPSPEGTVFLNTDPREYFFEDIGVENVGEVYRDFSTKKLGDGGEPTGQKLEAFFLYGTGMDYEEVSEATGMAPRTIKSFAYKMREDHGLLSENHRFTPEGYEFALMVLDQMDRLEEATESRVAAHYNGWEEVDPDEFEGNNYMAQALKSKYLGN